jgi:hypothetical protein
MLNMIFMPVKQKSVTHLIVLLVLTDRGIIVVVIYIVEVVVGY